MATYTVPSGDRIWAGRDVVMPDPDDVSFTWPPAPALTIPPVDGVDAPLHPKVLDIGSQWNGYRYWMVFTPFPKSGDPSPDAFENPSIVASNDGETWIAPAENPIIPAPDGAGYSKFNSDPHLVFKDGVMYMFWRPCDTTIPISSGREKIMYATTTDGASWSDSTTIYSTTVDIAVTLSPVIDFFDGYWWLWMYRRDFVPMRCELRKATTLGGLQAADAVVCDLVLPDETVEPWHFDVVRIPNGWMMLLSDRVRSTYTFGGAWLAVSDDGINWIPSSSVMSESAPTMYRPSLVLRSDKSGFNCYITDYDARKIRQLSLTLGV